MGVFKWRVIPDLDAIKKETSQQVTTPTVADKTLDISMRDNNLIGVPNYRPD